MVAVWLARPMRDRMIATRMPCRVPKSRTPRAAARAQRNSMLRTWRMARNRRAGSAGPSRRSRPPRASRSAEGRATAREAASSASAAAAVTSEATCGVRRRRGPRRSGTCRRRPAWRRAASPPMLAAPVATSSRLASIGGSPGRERTRAGRDGLGEAHERDAEGAGQQRLDSAGRDDERGKALGNMADRGRRRCSPRSSSQERGDGGPDRNERRRRMRLQRSIAIRKRRAGNRDNQASAGRSRESGAAGSEGRRRRMLRECAARRASAPGRAG